MVRMSPALNGQHVRASYNVYQLCHKNALFFLDFHTLVARSPTIIVISDIKRIHRLRSRRSRLAHIHLVILLPFVAMRSV